MNHAVQWKDQSMKQENIQQTIAPIIMSHLQATHHYKTVVNDKQGNTKQIPKTRN